MQFDLYADVVGINAQLMTLYSFFVQRCVSSVQLLAEYLELPKAEVQALVLKREFLL